MTLRRIKVLTVVGTRPEIIRLSSVIKKLDLFCDHVLVHTGQNYDPELNTLLFSDLKLRAPDHVLDCGKFSKSSAETVAAVIGGIDSILEAEQPDAFFVLGDTNSCLSVVAAKHRKIPIFHMEAGNRCFDERVPEETNRRVVDHISDVNLTYSAIAREYLLKEGFPPDRVIKVGSPMAEVLTAAKDSIDRSQILDNLKLTSKQYFVVSIHRAENIEADDSCRALFDALNQIASIYELPMIVSTHPRTKKKLSVMKMDLHRHIQLHKPFGFYDYLKLQQEARAVLSDSGTISEESVLLGFPALNLRESHERPEAMEAAAVMMTGVSSDGILQALEVLLSQKGSPNLKVDGYHESGVSDKVVRIIVSYTGYINRVVWRL